jgi:hypothetical protein
MFGNEKYTFEVTKSDDDPIVAQHLKLQSILK